MSPETRDLGIAALVRSEWCVDERQSENDAE
jgi:hypothetical protein